MLPPRRFPRQAASRNYSANTDVGKQTQYTVTGLEEGKIFYFAVTAYDNTRTIESGFSNEVSTIVQVTHKVYTVLPCRVADTRQTGTGNVPFSGQIEPGETVHFHVTSNLIAGQGGATDCGVPIGATGAFLNLTAVNPTGTGYLTLYPYGETQPTASTLNFQAGRIATASGVLAPLCDPAGGSGCAYDLTLTNGPGASVHLLIDVSGYLAVPEVAP